MTRPAAAPSPPRPAPKPIPRPEKDRYRPQFGVIVLCDDEAHQKAVFEDLKRRGLRLRVVST